MVKKEEILELLNAYKSEVDNFNDAIFIDKFEVLAQDIVKLFAIPVVSGSCPIDAIMHYDKLIKTKLDRTFEPLRDHGTHAVFCDKINDLREEAKSNYR